MTSSEAYQAIEDYLHGLGYNDMPNTRSVDKKPAQSHANMGYTLTFNDRDEAKGTDLSTIYAHYFNLEVSYTHTSNKEMTEKKDLYDELRNGLIRIGASVTGGGFDPKSEKNVSIGTIDFYYGIGTCI
jgi:hypothetical protein